MADVLDRPKLRNVEAFPVQSNGKQLLCLRDPQGFAVNPVVLTHEATFLLRYFDGDHTISEIQTAFTRRFGQLIYSDKIIALADSLDRALFLEGPRFESHVDQLLREFRAASVRPSSHAGGGYPGEAEALKTWVDSFYDPPRGPGRIETPTVEAPRRRRIAALVAPHIDYTRGGHVYAWAHRELAEAEPVDLFVILGINHATARRLFTFTTKDFQTPLGVMPTDRESVEFFRQRCGDWIFEEELCHRNEHSIELQVVFLQHLLGVRAGETGRPVGIVPLLCSSFLHLLEPGQSPDRLTEFSLLTAALREFVSTYEGRVCVIASVDLSHVGPRFGDGQPLSPSFLCVVERQNLALLEKAAALDAEGFLQQIREEEDRTRIDAVPAIYAMLKSLSLQPGRLLKYDQSVDGAGQTGVTFASMAFEAA